MTHHCNFQIALLTAICVLGIACSDAPTDSLAELTGPQLAKGGNKGPPAGDPSITATFADGEGDNITSDGRGSYVDGVCNVGATFNLEDARLYLKGGVKRKDQATCGDPRRFLVDFTDRVPGSPLSPQDGNVGVEGSFMNVDHVEMVTEADGLVSRTATFHTPGCGLGLKFNSTQSTTDFPVNDVGVKQNPDGTWTVKTQPFPNDVAVCIPSEQGEERRYYHMPFSLTISLKDGG
jgi:hypothetical protein